MPKHQFSYWPKMEKVFIEAILKMESTELSFTSLLPINSHCSQPSQLSPQSVCFPLHAHAWEVTHQLMIGSAQPRRRD